MASPWLAATYVPRLSLKGEYETQIAVVGGGAAGAALSYFLSHRRVGVALLEAGAVGAGATGQSHGLFLEGIHYPYAVARKVLGADRARAMWELTREGHLLARLVLGEERFDCAYARRGSLRVADSPAERAAAAESLPLLQADGFTAEMTDHGLVVPNDGEIDPARFVRALVDRAAAVGVKILENTRVTRIEDTGSRVELTTPAGKVRAEVAVVAAGAESPTICPYLEEAIFPAPAEAVVTEPTGSPPEMPRVAASGRVVVRGLRDGRVLAVGLGKGVAVETELAKRVPGAAVAERWSPVFGFSCDELPDVGPLPGSPRIQVCGGFHGHDLTLGLVCAKMLQETLTDGKTDYPIRMFDPRRHGV